MLRQVFVLLALFFCLSFVQAQDKPNVRATVNSADFSVVTQVIDGLPNWQYYQNDNTSYVYQITFQGLWEIQSGNGSDYNVVAGSDVTSFITKVNLRDGTVNNSKIVDVNLQGMNMRSINFTTHVPLNAVNGTDYPAGKFDVIINDYTWTNSSSQLVLAYKVDYNYQESSSNVPATRTPDLSTYGTRTVNFGDAYFSINSTANGGSKLNASVGVALKRSSELNSTYAPNSVHFSNYSVFVVYDHFDSNLNHDPEFGFGKGPKNSYIWIIIIVVVVIAIIVIILIAVIGFVLVRRRRRSYDAF